MMTDTHKSRFMFTAEDPSQYSDNCEDSETFLQIYD
jgi:hypothetical protein